MTTPRPQKNRPHHHGNLRHALINAGLEIVAQSGPDALTLRKCALISGVSHAAPAHHFGGVTGLKMAIIARGHVMFAKMMRDAQTQADPAPMPQLAAICEGYIGFARQHSGLFKFMFQPHGAIPPDLNDITKAEIDEASAASYDILHRACMPFAFDAKGALHIETMVWSMVHGYAMLFANGSSNHPEAPVAPEFCEILAQLNLQQS